MPKSDKSLSSVHGGLGSFPSGQTEYGGAQLECLHWDVEAGGSGDKTILDHSEFTASLEMREAVYFILFFIKNQFYTLYSDHSFISSLQDPSTSTPTQIWLLFPLLIKKQAPVLVCFISLLCSQR